MHEFYKSPQVFPPIGLSDHNTIIVSPACKVKKAKSIFVYKRDLRQSWKEAMGRFLMSIQWSTIFAQTQSCKAMMNKLYDIILDLTCSCQSNELKKKLRRCSLDDRKRQKAFFNYGPKSNWFKYY